MRAATTASASPGRQVAAPGLRREHPDEQAVQHARQPRVVRDPGRCHQQQGAHAERQRDEGAGSGARAGAVLRERRAHGQPAEVQQAMRPAEVHQCAVSRRQSWPAEHGRALVAQCLGRPARRPLCSASIRLASTTGPRQRAGTGEEDGGSCMRGSVSARLPQPARARNPGNHSSNPGRWTFKLWSANFLFNKTRELS